MPLDTSQAIQGALSGEQAGASFEFSTAAADQPEWFVRAFTLREELSRTYTLELELGTHGDARAAADMLGKNVSLRWDHKGEAQYTHGIVDRVEYGAQTERMSIVYIVVVPALAALEHSASSRIFAERTIPQIVQDVLVSSLSAFERSLRFDLAEATYPKREYVVQHRETDLDFVQRMLAEQGLWYYFEQPHDALASELLVVTDSRSSAPRASEEAVPVTREADAAGNREAVVSFARSEQMRSTHLLVRQFDWTRPDQLEEREVEADEQAGFALALHEHGDIASYDYNEPRYTKHDTDHQARMRLDAQRVERVSFEGAGNVTCLRAGYVVSLEGTDYLLTSIAHAGHATASLDGAGQRGTYRNHFKCVERERPYRPQRRTKPRVEGAQTALVVDRNGGVNTPTSSGEGEDIVTDVHGRVRVKFHWDLTQAGASGTSSCWARVSQFWAGAGWGAQFIPRVGMEVIVQFIDGDVDQPVITGCVYNGLNAPPYAHSPTQSGIKTASSVDPSRYNELRFEDARGHEQIFVRAQRDYVEEVLHDHVTTVHGSQTQKVSRTQSESIGGDQSLSVGGNRTKSVAGSEVVSVVGERHLKVQGASTELYEAEHHVTVAKGVSEVFEATHDLCVTGRQTLELKSDKLEHVVGTYELTTDKAYVLNQGATKLTFEGEKVILDAAGAVTIKRGTASIEIDVGGNISVTSSTGIALEVGPNKLTLSSSGIAIEGVQVLAKAGPSELALSPTAATLSSVHTSVEATAVCTLKGAALLGLNS